MRRSADQVDIAGREARPRQAPGAKKPPAANSPGPMTRGGWPPAGTAASRRARTKRRVTPKGAQTRAHLIAAARRVFESRGYFDASVPDIVTEAGLAQGSFYTYFDSKREVFQEVASALGDEIRAVVTLSTGSADPTAECLAQSNVRLFAAYKDNARLFVLIEQVATVDPVVQGHLLAARNWHVDRIASSIEHLQGRGLSHKDINPQVAAGALVSMISNYSYWSLAEGGAGEDEVIRELTKIWARRLG